MGNSSLPFFFAKFYVYILTSYAKYSIFEVPPTNIKYRIFILDIRNILRNLYFYYTQDFTYVNSKLRKIWRIYYGTL